MNRISKQNRKTMTQQKSNPFKAGNWVRGEHFFGRSELVRTILDGQYRYIWLAGMRRIGKTSVLKQLEWQCHTSPYRERYVPLFWNMQGAGDVEGLAELLVESVEDALPWFAQTTLQISDLEGKNLFDMLRTLKNAVRQSGKELLLLCDECEELLNVQQQSPNALPRLRRFFEQGEDVLTVLTATRRLLALSHHPADRTSPFLHGFLPPIWLGELEPEAARALVARGGFSNEVVEQICRECNNHPYLLQQLASRVFECGDVTQSIRELAADAALANYFAVDYDLLDEPEKKVLQQILLETAIDEAALSRKTAFQSENVAAILQALRQMGFIRRENTQWKIANVFLASWLKRTLPALPQTEDAASAAGGSSELVGQVVGHYRVEAFIGKGGMGTVWKATDQRLHRAVALKMLSGTLADDPAIVARFRQEAQAVARLNHPHIAQIFDVGIYQGLPFLVMEYVEGQTLDAWRQTAGSPDQHMEVALQIAAGVAHAHDKGVVHRDIKPGNILVTPEGVVKITDFGLAKIAEAATNLTETGESMGTPAYMAPEQVAGVATDARTDIYSLGVVWYELYAGRLPYQATGKAALVYAIIHEPPEDIRLWCPDLPEKWAAAIMHMLAKKPDERPQNIREILQILADNTR
jgi:predicted Ser/Thr protein kinase